MLATPREGTKVGWGRSLHQRWGNSWGETLCELWATNTPGSWEIKWSMKKEGWGSAPQPPTGVKTHCQQVILWPHQHVPLFLHGNLGSFISHNVGKSPESPITTEAFIWAVHFLEPISFSRFRPFHQMDALAWWQVQKRAWSKRATEVNTQFPQMGNICHPYLSPFWQIRKLATERIK